MGGAGGGRGQWEGGGGGNLNMLKQKISAPRAALFRVLFSPSLKM